MSTPETPSNYTPADWDLAVLETPTVLDLPGQIPENPEPLLLEALEALVANFLNEPSSPERVGQLARTGIVALHTSSGSLELHETLLGWTLVQTVGTPDPHDLATAARLRAHRLAGERRHHPGGRQ
jgi:hypothetical protein